MADGKRTSGDVVLHALGHLTVAEAERFVNKLSEINFEGKRNIPRGSLEKADTTDTKDLLLQFYGSDSAIDVTIQAFTEIGLVEAADRLREERRRVSDLREAQEVPGEISDFRRRHVEHVVEQCRLIEERNVRLGERVPLKKRNTKLLIVERHHIKKRCMPRPPPKFMPHGRRHTAMMDGLADSKLYLNLDTLFDSVKYEHRPRTVVLLGPAGIGKTMTAQKLMLGWALGEIYQGLFEYVFYLRCREINEVRSHRSVIDVIGACCPDMTVPVSALLADPSRILFILDGFDELKFSLDLKKDQLCMDPRQKKPVEVTLSNLLRRNILPKCTIIITTRPTALERLQQCMKADLCAEIMGFTEEDKKSYFSGFFGNDEQASQALAVVKDNDTLYTMCFLPIVCWIVCTVMKQQLDRGQDITNSSKTITSVYLFFLSTLLRDHSGASTETMRRSLKRLCSLALNGIFEQKILFNEEDLTQSGLEVSDIQSLFLNHTIFQRDIYVYSAYSFIHLSFQEFFAAMFFILDLDEGSPNPQRDLKQILKEYSEDTGGHLILTVRFLFGLFNKDQVRHVEKILGYKISPSSRAGLVPWLHKPIKNSSLLGKVRVCKTSPSARDDLVAWLQEPKKKRLLEVFHCLHETQDEEITSRAMDNIQNIEITEYNDSIVNLKAISFCLKHCQGDQTLKMSGINFGPEVQEIMRPGLINCSTLRLICCKMGVEPDISVLLEVLTDPQSRLKELSLNGCEITVATCAALAAALRSSRSLLDLDLNCNKLGDAGATVLCDGLKHPDTRLQKIHLYLCGITGASCAALAAVLCSNRSLLDLDLEQNKLGDAGASLLWEALKHPDTRLQKIRLIFCGITGASCAALAAALPSNRSLLELDLKQNELGDAGATLISEALKRPDTRLQKINLDCCGITGASCAALAAALCSGRSLLDLGLRLSTLGDAGATLLCDALKHPDTRLQKINLNSCEITGASCAALAAALRPNRSLLELDLGCNPLGDAGATLLWEALKHPLTRLQKINLRGCEITGATCAALVAALCSGRSLLELDLGWNNLGDAGASLLCDALKHPNTRLQKICLNCCGITDASCEGLAAVLRSNRSLMELDLGWNNLGDAGASLLCDALKHPNTRLQKI
ncbi:NACHT, LRR and PYD domains-containing protein 12-like isoform X2 [Lissotriton helveticus]